MHLSKSGISRPIKWTANQNMTYIQYYECAIDTIKNVLLYSVFGTNWNHSNVYKIIVNQFSTITKVSMAS